MKKLVTLLLAVCMFASAPMAFADEEIPSLDVMVLSNYVVSEDGLIYQAIQDQLGIDLNVTFVTDSYQEKLSTVIASGDLPDVFGADLETVQELAKYGMILELTDLLDEYGQNILNDRQETAWTMGANKTGEIYGVPEARFYPYVMAVRKDWMRNLGYEVTDDMTMEMTLDEFYTLMDEFTNNDPDGNSLDDTMGVGVAMSGINSFNPLFAAFDISRMTPILLEDGTVTTYLKHPRYLEAIAYIRALYQNDMTESDFVTIDIMSHLDKLWNGKVGAFCWNPPGTTNNWLPRYTEEVLPEFVYVKITDNDGTGGGYFISPSTDYVVISADCEDPALAMEMLNWFCTYEAEELSYLGIEGVHYEWTDEDTYQFEYLEPYASDLALQRVDGNALWGRFRKEQGNMEVLTMNELSQAGVALGYSDTVSNAFIFGVPEIQSQLGSTLDDIVLQALATLITMEGDEEDVAAAYAEFVSRWEQSGGTTWEQQATEIYNEEN